MMTDTWGKTKSNACLYRTKECFVNSPGHVLRAWSIKNKGMKSFDTLSQLPAVHSSSPREFWQLQSSTISLLCNI